MNDLNQQIDIAQQYKAAPAETAPELDHSAQAATGLGWAARQETPPPAEVPQLKPIVPLAN